MAFIAGALTAAKQVAAPALQGLMGQGASNMASSAADRGQNALTDRALKSGTNSGLSALNSATTQQVNQHRAFTEMDTQAKRQQADNQIKSTLENTMTAMRVDSADSNAKMAKQGFHDAASAVEKAR